MEKETLIRYLNNQAELSSSDFKDLIHKHPYFSLGRVLYLKELKKENQEEFEKELKKHAIYISDRSQLHRMIYNYNKEDIRRFLSKEIITEPSDEELLDFSYSQKKEKKKEIILEKPNTKKKEETDTEKSPGFTDWIERVENDSPEKPKPDIIEKFVEAGPGAIRPDKESQLKGDVSKHSVEEDESFITDTLAKIYVKQGLYSKAIYAYEKLSLKYPEKNVYFASQIEEIKKLINK